MDLLSWVWLKSVFIIWVFILWTYACLCVCLLLYLYFWWKYCTDLKPCSFYTRNEVINDNWWAIWTCHSISHYFWTTFKKLINYISYSNVPRKTYALLHGLNFGFQQCWRYRLFFWVMLISAVGHWLIIQLKKVFIGKKK